MDVLLFELNRYRIVTIAHLNNFVRLDQNCANIHGRMANANGRPRSVELRPNISLQSDVTVDIEV